MSPSTRSVQFRRSDESWKAFLQRLGTIRTDMVIVLSPVDVQSLSDEAERSAFLDACGPLKHRLWLAVKDRGVAAAARERGLRVIDRAWELKLVLRESPQLDDALRAFSPNVWQQQLRSRLQAMGLLSMPKLRIWALLGTSVILFLFVVFRLLPSAEVHVWSRQDMVGQTMNVYVVQSGAQLLVPQSARKIPLIPLTVEIERSFTFDQITPEFTGTRSQMPLTIFNTSREQVSLRKGSRVVASGGLVFRTEDAAVVPAGSRQTVRAVAEDHDLYGQIMGARGNVPANLRWDFISLSEEDQKVIYAKNLREGRNGTTASVLRYNEKDKEIAGKKLDHALIDAATQAVTDRLQELNDKRGEGAWQMFSDKKLITAIFHDYKLSEEFLGQETTSVPIEGAVTYTVLVFDASEILGMMQRDISAHIEEDRLLVPESITLGRLGILPIQWDDQLRWVKVTADLSATEKYLLDPLTPVGAKFGKRVREAIAGLRRTEAERIIRNMPEVENVQISLWPPWSVHVTSIPGNISIVPE